MRVEERGSVAALLMLGQLGSVQDPSHKPGSSWQERDLAYADVGRQARDVADEVRAVLRLEVTREFLRRNRICRSALQDFGGYLTQADDGGANAVQALLSIDRVAHGDKGGLGRDVSPPLGPSQDRLARDPICMP